MSGKHCTLRQELIGYSEIDPYAQSESRELTEFSSLSVGTTVSFPMRSPRLFGGVSLSPE